MCYDAARAFCFLKLFAPMRCIRRRSSIDLLASRDRRRSCRATSQMMVSWHRSTDLGPKQLFLARTRREIRLDCDRARERDGGDKRGKKDKHEHGQDRVTLLLPWCRFRLPRKARAHRLQDSKKRPGEPKTSWRNGALVSLRHRPCHQIPCTPQVRCAMNASMQFAVSDGGIYGVLGGHSV